MDRLILERLHKIPFLGQMIAVNYNASQQHGHRRLNILSLYTILLKSLSMSQTKISMALTIIGGLFLLIGVQGMASAQMSNDTGMMGNTTNATGWMGNSTNATSAGNMTGNISGCADRGC